MIANKKRGVILLLTGLLMVCGFWAIGFKTPANEEVQQTAVADFSIDRLEQLQLDTLVLATVGDACITGREFYISYEMGPSFVKRSSNENARFKHLELMIAEKIMAQEGQKKGIDQRADLQVLLAEIGQDLAVTRLYEDEIIAGLEVDSAAIEKALEEDLLQLSLRYVLVPTENALAELHAQMNQGTSFDSISVPGNQLINEDNLTFWRLNHAYPEIASAILNLDMGQTSEPIHTPGGIFQVRLDAAFRDPIITLSQREQRKTSLGKQLKQMLADSVAFEYAANAMEAAQPVIRRTAFDALFNYFESMHASGTREQVSLMQGSWPGSLNREAIEESTPEVLIRSNAGTFTIDQFLDWYDLRRFPVKGSTPAHRANQLKSIIWRMFRDRLMGAEARQKGYESHPEVDEELRWWRDKLSYWEVREALLEQVNPDQEAVLKQMQDYPHRYEGKSDHVQLELAYKDAYTLAERRILMDYLRVMNERYSVEVDSQRVRSMPLTDGRSRKPIELIALKKEGTFPRIAYPTIDRVWERY